MYNDIINWLQNHLLLCPFKSIFGIDCPGCGFQRAFIALLKGNFSESLYLYPAVIPIIITVIVLLADQRYRFDRNLKIKKGLYLFTGSIIAVSYVSKMVLLYYHHH